MVSKPDDAISDNVLPDDIVSYWNTQIEAAQKIRKKWYDRANKINERYLSAKDNSVEYDAHTMNVLWSNVETKKPALYAKTPNAKVSRRFRDKDPIGRWAAITLERSLGFGLDCYDFDYTMRSCTSDYLLVAIGQVWCSYEPKIEGEKIEWEAIKNKHLHFKDFLHGPARTWDEVPWVAQCAYLTKDEVSTKFGKDIAKQLVFEERKGYAREESPDKGSEKKAAIWELWSKTKNLVYFVSKNCPTLLKPAEAPFLNLESFFPCPRPLLGTCTTDNMIPTPEFILYQNQADEIDMLTQRINLLTQALRVVGLYDATQSSLQNLLDKNNRSNEMVACSNWAVFAQNGGIEGSVAFFPLKEIIGALQQCYVSRDSAKQVMYEITGISDIVRGASDPNETATAQTIKSQWGGLRIRDQQKDVQRFARDILRINAEIMSENFQPDTLKTMSNVPLLMKADQQKLQQRAQFVQQAQQMQQQNPQQAQQILQANPQLAQMIQPLTLDEMQALKEPCWEDVAAFLKDQKLRSFRIDIETDSTINADDQDEKTQRTEFVTAVTSMVTTWGPIIMQEPKITPLFGELLLFATRAFHTAEGLETAIEEMVETFSQRALMPPQPPPPDPKVQMEKEKMDREDKQREADRNADIQKAQGQQHADVQKEQIKSQASVEQEKIKSQGAVAAQLMEAQKARAAGPQGEDVQAAMAPLLQAIQEMMQGMAQGQAQLVQKGQQDLQAAFAMLSQAANGPKQIMVHRDKNGRIIGGTAAPAQGAMN